MENEISLKVALFRGHGHCVASAPWYFDANGWLEVCYACFPEGRARRSGVRVPIIRDHVVAHMLLGFGGLAGHGKGDQQHPRRGALADLKPSAFRSIGVDATATRTPVAL
jgi:hypothetical protein